MRCLTTIGVHNTPKLVCCAHQDTVTPCEGVHSTPNFGWCDSHPMVWQLFGVLCTPQFLECTWSMKMWSGDHFTYGLNQHRLENVQRAATRLVTSIKHLTYEQRILMLKLTALQYRWQHADMICVCSLFNNIYDMDNSSFFYLSWQYSYQGPFFQTF